MSEAITPDSERLSPERKYRIEFQHGFSNRGTGHSSVGVCRSGTIQRVWWITQDSRYSDSNQPTSVEKSLADSCENCGFHRGSFEQSFEATNHGLSCLSSTDPRYASTHTLPSSDNLHFQEGCICPKHIKYGTDEWKKYVIKNNGYTLTNYYIFDTNQRVLIYNYGDVVIIKKTGELDRILTREEYPAELTDSNKS